MTCLRLFLCEVKMKRSLLYRIYKEKIFLTNFIVLNKIYWHKKYFQGKKYSDMWPTTWKLLHLSRERRKKKLEIKITTGKSFQIDLKSGYAHSNCNIKNGTDIFTHNQPLYNSNVPTRQISIKCVRQFIRPNSQHTFNLFAISRR